MELRGRVRIVVAVAAADRKGPLEHEAVDVALAREVVDVLRRDVQRVRVERRAVVVSRVARGRRIDGAPDLGRKRGGSRSLPPF